MVSTKRVLITVLALTLASGLFASGRSGAAGTGAAQSGSLTIWSMMTQPERIQSFQALADAYTRVNPNVRATIEVMPWGGALDRLVAAHMAGNPPEISLLGSGWSQLLAGADALMEVTPLINESGGVNSYLKIGLDLGLYEGGYYGIPLYVAPLFTVYRKSAAQQAGITTLPTTWEQYYNMAVALTDRSQNRYGFGQVMGGPQSSIAIWPFLQSNNVSLVNVDRNGNWYVSVDAAERNRLIEVYDFLYRLMRDASPAGVITYTQEQLRELIASGNIMTRLDTVEIFYDFKTRGNMEAFNDVGYFPVPGNQRLATGTGGANLGIFNRGNTALASDYLKWIFEGDRMVDFYISYPYAMFPVRSAMYNSADYIAKLPDELKALMPDMALNTLANASFLMFANGPFPYAGEVENQLMLAKPLVAMFNNGITAAQAADMLINDLQVLVR